MVEAEASTGAQPEAAKEKEPFVFKKLGKEEIIAAQQAAVLQQEHLAQQSLENFDVSRITPLNPEIISRQATINIGTIGHVAHGKSTLVRAVSGTNVSKRILQPLHYISVVLTSSTPHTDRPSLP